MARIVGQHADGSACYTPSCKNRFSTNDTRAVEDFIADVKKHEARHAQLVSEPAPVYTDPDEQEWWEGIRKQHRTVTIHGREFTLAPKGKSGVYCFECNTYLPEGSLSGASAAPVTCPGCGDLCKSGLTGISLRHDNRRFLTARNVIEARWYHTSSRPNWDAGQSEQMAHLGTRAAALDRVHDIDHSDGQLYLYEVEFESDTMVNDRLYEEDQFDPTQANYAADHVRGGINRYLNFYENPGSISLYASRGAFRVISKTPLT